VRSCSATRDLRRDNGSRSVRGRQSANPRLTGGLVMHEQAKRSRASPVGIRYMAAGSKRAAIRVAWSACWDLPALASHVGKFTWRRPTAVGYGRGGSSLRVPNAGAPGRAATRPRQPPLPGLLQPGSIASCLVSRGSHASRADPLRSSTQRAQRYRRRPLATTGSPARSSPPDRLHRAAGLRGHFDDRS
jgi:hypothetical protein